MPVPRRESNKTRQAGPWPSPIGMGALVGYGDFERAKASQAHHKGEESAFESGGMSAVKEYRKKNKLD